MLRALWRKKKKKVKTVTEIGQHSPHCSRVVRRTSEHSILGSSLARHISEAVVTTVVKKSPQSLELSLRNPFQNCQWLKRKCKTDTLLRGPAVHISTGAAYLPSFPTPHGWKIQSWETGVKIYTCPTTKTPNYIAVSRHWKCTRLVTHFQNIFVEKKMMK